MTLRVKIEPQSKKSISEISYYFNEDKTVEAVKDDLWRWGTFYIDMTQSEYDRLVADSAKDDWMMNTEISAYDNFELEEVWDGIASDVEFHPMGRDEKRLEKVELYKAKLEEEEEKWNYDYHEWLDEHGFEYIDCEYWIVGPVLLEIVNDTD